MARLSRRLGNLTCPKEKAVVVGPHTTISTHHDTSTGVCTHLGMQKQFLSVDDLAGKEGQENDFFAGNPIDQKKELGVSEVKTTEDCTRYMVVRNTKQRYGQSIISKLPFCHSSKQT